MDLVEVLEKINRSSLRFLQTLTPEATYQTIIEEAIKLVNGDEGYLALAESGKLNIKYAYLPNLGNVIMRKRGYSYTSFSQKKAFVTYIEDFKSVHPEMTKAGIQSTIFIPLSNRGVSIGVMNIMSHRRMKRFSQKELSILKLFGSLASLAIHKTQLYSETKVALEMRDHFIAMAAHELKTPLTSVSGYIQLLHDKLVSTKTTESRWIEQLYNESQRLKNLVNELLAINQIKSGKLSYFMKVCSLREILKSTKRTAELTFPHRKLTFEDKLNGLSDLTIGDHDKIMQMLTNLIENAVKFSSHRSSIKIVLDFKKPNFIVSVEDQGIGIPKNEVKKIFQEYQKGSRHDREGMGIGLFLVKDILTRLHGNIKVRSKVGKGTIMEVRLPKANI